jgi:type I restriction enzyme S subunit
METLPSWKTSRLKFKARINPRASESLDASASVSFLPMDAVGDDGTLRRDQTRIVSEVSQGYTYFEEDDVSIAKITPCYENGKGAVMTGLVGGMGFGSTELIILRPESDVDSKYLYYLTQSSHFRLPGEAHMLGAGGQKRVPDLFVKDFSTPWPPKPIQVSIANYLDSETDRIDILIKAKRSLRSTLDGFARSTFLAELVDLADTLPGKYVERLPWLPNTPSAWSRCKLKHLVEHFDQGISPQCEARPPSDDEWGVLKAGCINTGSFDPMESKALPPGIPAMPEVTVCKGDLIISRANTKDLVGRSAVAQMDYPKLMLSDKLYRLRLNLSRCIPEFVRRTLWVSAVRSRIEERATGASPSMLNIDRRTILELDMVLPTVPEQMEILKRVDERADAIRKLVFHVDQEIELLQILRKSTITDAVLGRIDVQSCVQSNKAQETTK